VARAAGHARIAAHRVGLVVRQPSPARRRRDPRGQDVTAHFTIEDGAVDPAITSERGVAQQVRSVTRLDHGAEVLKREVDNRRHG
jgi:hypothetical protein